MSAYLVPGYHIDALVTYAALTGGGLSYYWQGSRRAIRGDEARVASVLYAENVRSVNARYAQHDSAHGHRYRPVLPMLRAIDIIKACHGYAYQACETDDWESTEAAAVVRAIEAGAVRMLPGYADSPGWCLDAPTARARA